MPHNELYLAILPLIHVSQNLIGRYNIPIEKEQANALEAVDKYHERKMQEAEASNVVQMAVQK